MEKLSDSRLIDLVRGDNQHAFTTLVNRYWENMYRHIHAKLRHEEDTKDILQEIFITVWKNRGHLYVDDNGTLGAYLYRAARYCIIDYFGRPKTAICDEAQLHALLAQEVTLSAHELLVSKEMEQRVNDALSRLPERLQLPYRLSRYQHLTNKEIAARLSLSEQTVKNNISLTLQRLRLSIHEKDGFAILFILLVTHPS
ncbi:RNA polymerase sigma factor [Chitinophaga japonensis]|uniref:RNA polymerase sigma-70 factor (ECF subfamily) n=1 Tax=Chitinophaga japonensis TaxID=104662 RepID=A0A562TD56_CHIJA|nr:sigma-70 family RNA polymerase sigma factor [Chitinophaga japonensis]TWI91006.1 RNA polymerase sigma-70 factor (ECF subfamily) [Chitinophaga japonensis]